jgi:hypothetical protein
LALGTASSSIDLEYGPEVVFLGTEHIFKLDFFEKVDGTPVGIINFLFGGDLLLIILESEGYLFDEALSFIIVGDPLAKVLDLAHLGFGAGAIFPEGRVCRAKLFFF